MDLDHRVEFLTTSVFDRLSASISIVIVETQVKTYSIKCGTLKVRRNLGVITSFRVLLEPASQFLDYSAAKS